MLIQSTESLSTIESSPFALRHRDFAEIWETFAEKQQAEIEGKYNAYFADFDLKGQISGFPYQLHGHQKLVNASGGIIPTQGRYQEETTLEIHIKKPDSLTFSLRKNSLPRRLSGYQKWGYQKEFVLKASHQGNALHLLPYQDWEPCFVKYNLRELTFEQGTLKIKFFHFINSGVALAEFWHKVEGLVKKL